MGTEELKKWMENAMLSQRQFATEFEIPVRTVESWMGGTRKPPSYVVKLLVDKLQEMTEKLVEERMRKEINKLKSDENNNRPVAAWVIIESKGCDEYVDFYENMRAAIKGYEHEMHTHNGNFDGTVAYIACNRTDDGKLIAWYTDKEDRIFANYDTIRI